MAIITNNIIYDGMELVYNGENSLIYSEDPYNPLDLPPYTIRLLFTPQVTPHFDRGTATRLSQNPNVWDFTYENSNWDNIFPNLDERSYLLEVRGANTTNVTSMKNLFGYCTALSSVSAFDTSNVTSMVKMFYDCQTLSSVPLFDTHNVTDMVNMFYKCYSLSSAPLFDTYKVREFSGMFYQCSSLSAIPLYDTTNAYNMNNMFRSAINVKTGALSLYQQASTQTTPPTYHVGVFKDCGINTTQGAAELAQIPSNWK